VRPPCAAGVTKTATALRVAFSGSDDEAELRAAADANQADPRGVGAVLLHQEVVGMADVLDRLADPLEVGAGRLYSRSCLSCSVNVVRRPVLRSPKCFRSMNSTSTPASLTKKDDSTR
jgi:hypothetical protein